MKEIKGIGVSNGIAIAPAYRLVEPDLSFEKIQKWKSFSDSRLEMLFNKWKHLTSEKKIANT